MSGRAERFTGRHGNVLAFEKLLGDSRGIRHLRIEVSGNIREHVKRAERRRAADSGNRAQTGEDAFATAGVLREHCGDGIH